MGWLSRLFGGEDPQTKEARRRMAADRQDPRKTFVWGVVAVSYELDPAYLTDHATEAIRDWYSVKHANDILTWTSKDFGTTDSVAYNQYRLCFLARAGFGAGLLTEQQSWELGMRHAAVLQQHYRGWSEFGQGYLEGHLNYRRSQGDPADKLQQYRGSINERLAEKQRTVWSAIPWATPMG